MLGGGSFSPPAQSAETLTFLYQYLRRKTYRSNLAFNSMYLIAKKNVIHSHTVIIAWVQGGLDYFLLCFLIIFRYFVGLIMAVCWTTFPVTRVSSVASKLGGGGGQGNAGVHGDLSNFQIYMI